VERTREEWRMRTKEENRNSRLYVKLDEDGCDSR